MNKAHDMCCHEGHDFWDVRKCGFNGVADGCVDCDNENMFCVIFERFFKRMH